MKQTTTLKSGAVLELHDPDFADACELLEAVVSELKAVNLDLDQLPKTLDADIMSDPKLINVFKNAICQMVGSKRVKAAVFACMARSLHNGEQITLKTFEQARQNYLPTVWEVTKFTLSPFFAGVNFASLTPSKDPGASQG